MEDVKVGDILIATNGTGCSSIKGELYKVIEIMDDYIGFKVFGLKVLGKRKVSQLKGTFLSNMSYFERYNPMNRNGANEG